MAAGQLVISFDELRGKGEQLVARADDLQAQLEAIHALAQPDGIWEGNAAAAYQTDFDRWATSQRTMLDALREMGLFLQRAAGAYESTEVEVQQALGLAG